MNSNFMPHLSSDDTAFWSIMIYNNIDIYNNVKRDVNVS